MRALHRRLGRGVRSLILPGFRHGRVLDQHQAVWLTYCVSLTEGSVAAPGFMKPEGIIIFHIQSQLLFKKTLERDEEPKSKAQAA